MKFHPFAEIFPLLEGDELDSLAADIKTNGLQKVITLYQGKVLDGRNRFLACQKVKVKPRYHKFDGDDEAALVFVWSANAHRRHMTPQQRAMAAARFATLGKGGDPNAPRGALTQTEAAEGLDVGRRSVQRAKKVVEHGSKALQDAVQSGEVPLTKAASVTDLPKREQLKAAKLTPEQKAVDKRVRDSMKRDAAKAKPEPDIEHWEPDEDEEANLAQAEKEYAASIDKVMGADDKLAAAHAEIKRQSAEIASLKLSRNQYQHQCGELVKRIKSLQRQIAKLRK